MSDEEKKAIEKIDYIQDFIIENGQYNADINDMEYFSRILNLIEKQSKEIEELKEGFKIQEHNYQVAMEEIEQRWEDKIKAKIDYLLKRYDSEEDYCSYEVIIRILQSLLEKE